MGTFLLFSYRTCLPAYSSFSSTEPSQRESRAATEQTHFCELASAIWLGGRSSTCRRKEEMLHAERVLSKQLDA